MSPYFSDVVSDIEARIEQHPEQCKKLRLLLKKIKRYTQQLPCLGFNSSKYVFYNYVLQIKLLFFRIVNAILAI